MYSNEIVPRRLTTRTWTTTRNQTRGRSFFSSINIKLVYKRNNTSIRRICERIEQPNVWIQHMNINKIYKGTTTWAWYINSTYRVKVYIFWRLF